MGALRDRMVANLRLRHLSPKTIKAYLWHMKAFTRYFGKAPDLLGEEEVRQYLLYLLDERKVSWSSMNIGYSALKFFYVNTLHRDWQVAKIPRPRGERRLPVVLSRQELKELFSATSNRKHRMIFRTIYSAGLRLSEAANLKAHHIESESMRIRVEQGKGRKDRYTLLAETVLVELRDYWRVYRPGLVALFRPRQESAHQPEHDSSGLSDGEKKAYITKPATVHTLHHCFATHVLEQGVDLLTLKKLLGHSSLRTTQRYTHIHHDQLRKVVSPLDELMGRDEP